MVAIIIIINDRIDYYHCHKALALMQAVCHGLPRNTQYVHFFTANQTLIIWIEANPENVCPALLPPWALWLSTWQVLASETPVGFAGRFLTKVLCLELRQNYCYLLLQELEELLRRTVANMRIYCKKVWEWSREYQRWYPHFPGLLKQSSAFWLLREENKNQPDQATRARFSVLSNKFLIEAHY
jgi:hypothetical protein